MAFRLSHAATVAPSQAPGRLVGRARTGLRSSGRLGRSPRCSRQVCRANETEWRRMWNDMNRAGVTSISPQEAKERVDSGEWVLVDIREPELYEKAHPTGAVSVPLFVKMTMENVSGVGDILKGAMLLSNGVTPVKGNPTFLEDLKKVAEAKGVILYCEAGGTLKPTTNFPYGKQSRSLVGTSKALDVGIENVAHLDGGIYGWFNAELPMDGEYDASMVGRTPNAALAATYPTKDEPY